MVGNGQRKCRHTSNSWAIARRCCFAIAVSFCCTIRNRDIDSLSWTLSLFCCLISS